MSVKTQLWLFGLLVLAVQVMLGGTSLWQCNQLLERLKNVTSVELPAVRRATLADMKHDGLRAILYSAVLASQKNDAQGLRAAHEEKTAMAAEFLEDINELANLKMGAEAEAALAEVRPAVEAYTKIVSEMVDLAVAGKLTEVEGLTPKFDELFELLEVKLEKMGEIIETLGRGQQSKGQNAVVILAAITAGGLLATILVSWLIISGLLKKMANLIFRITESSVALKGVSGQLSQSSQMLAKDSAHVASSLQSTASSLEELSNTIRHNAEHAQRASAVSQNSQQHAIGGEGEIKNFIAAISQLSQNSRKMSDIINVIDDIAFQTNLLALNAAVEAARAGEQGKGFAVVAEAVRNLAQRSASSAKDISSMISESIEKINEGARTATRSGELLSKIVESVKETATLTSEIQDASSEQAGGVSSISQAINELDTLSQHQSSNSQEIALSAEKLTKQTSTLHEIVAMVRSDFLGGEANVPAHASTGVRGGGSGNVVDFQPHDNNNHKASSHAGTGVSA